jgi:hypothetical protein
MIIRWISLVPSKIVKILEGTGRIIGIPARDFRSPYALAGLERADRRYQA